MKRLITVLILVTVTSLPVMVAVLGPQRMQAAGPQQVYQGDQAPLSARRDAPPDTTSYTRAMIPEDSAPKGRQPLPATLFPSLVVVDTVVNNTNAGLQNTDTFGDSEPSIAVNPANTNQISITAFSGSWNSAPIWNSSDGGNTWSKQNTIPRPPNAGGTNGQCPCDQDIDFMRGNLLEGTFLSLNPTDVYTGITSDPTNIASWNWKTTAGTADKTNAVGAGNADQPWTLTNRDNAVAAQDNIYVAYDNFSVNPIGMRIAVSLGANPPNFTRDNQSGTSGGAAIVNPGHRLAVDPRNGWVYSLFQTNTAAGNPGDWAVTYWLNRSIDGGVTWTLNGSGTGIQVAAANSTQGIGPTTTFDGSGNCIAPQPNNLYKFGTVNALLGGVDHAAVDPNNGDVYYVYGTRDGGTGNNRLSIIRLTDNGGGGLNIGAPNFVTGQVQAALPSVAVAANGVVGVLYTQYDGVSGGFPSFSAHLAMSEDHGVTFQDFVLENFLSPSADNGNCRQRVLGDYQQIKAVGNTFFGVFTGNGVPFGRTTSNLDPIFFRTQAACTITCPANISVPAPPGQCNAVVNYPAPTATSCGTVTCVPASGSTFPVGTTAVNCTTQSGPACNFNITVTDNQVPTIVCPASIAKFTDSGQFSALLNIGVPVAADNCGVSVTATRSDGKALNQPYPVGLTSVVWKATDPSGNSASCGQNIVVMVPSGQRRIP